MGYPYYCISCGEKLNDRSETLVSLSWIALNSTFNDIIETNPIYITDSELKKLVEKADQGVLELSLLDFLRIAYNERNYNSLDESKMDSAEKAYEVYLKSFDKAYAFKMRGEQKNNDKLQNEYDLDIEFGTFGDLLQSEDENGKSWIERIKIPGFPDILVPQIIENFPQNKCKCWISYDEANGGYFYEVQGAKKKKTRTKTPCCVCPKCKGEVLTHAFNYRHVLVGLLGTQNVGKSCLVAALCSKLKSDGGILDLPKTEFKKYEDEFLDEYEAGYPLDKTRGTGNNLIHPSIRYNDILWTFVDIPGEAFYDQTGKKLDPANILENPKIRMSMNCHIYIFCADATTRAENGSIINFKSVFEDYLNLSYGYNKSRAKHFPILFALTKIDEEPEDFKKNKAKEYQYSWNDDYYPKRYKQEYALINKIGKEYNLYNLINIGGILSNHYFTPITCTAYGFETFKREEEAKIFKHKNDWKIEYLKKHPETPNEQIPHPVFKIPSPRNLDLIYDWMERIIGNKPIWKGSNYCTDLSKICRNEFHFDDNLSKAIASMFCNPSETDNQWINTIGKGVFTMIEQKMLMLKYQNKDNKGV